LLFTKEHWPIRKTQHTRIVGYQANNVDTLLPGNSTNLPKSNVINTTIQQSEYVGVSLFTFLSEEAVI
jgi:hypothetical protein